MLDINIMRQDPEGVKNNVARRKKEYVVLVDELLKVDKQWRELKGENDALRSRRNKLSEEINAAKKSGKDVKKILAEAKKIPETLTEQNKHLDALQEKVRQLLLRIPNLLHPSVPQGKDVSENPVVRTVGKPTKKDFPLVNHAELAEQLGVVDFDQGRMVAGQGFNYLLNELALLDLALQRYGIDFLVKKGFTVVVPPMLLNRESLGAAVDLSAFEEVIYKVEGEDFYLIGTAEHSLVNYLRNRTLDASQLPLKLCAVTPCFRKEIGGHGVDTKGLFRMHQFNKVEQVVACLPEKSDKMLEEMQAITEEFFQSLGIPYRVIELCSGDLGMKSAKQYDIEAWFPRQEKYGEVTSAGNCTDYQAVALNTRFVGKEKKGHVHLLNNTMVATSRAMVAILENYQNKDGTVDIPKVLHKYCGFKKIGGKK